MNVIRNTGKQFAHRREHAGVEVAGFERGVRPIGLLVDIDDFIEVLQPLNIAIRCRLGNRRAVQLALGDGEQGYR